MQKKLDRMSDGELDELSRRVDEELGRRARAIRRAISVIETALKTKSQAQVKLQRVALLDGAAEGLLE